MKHLKFTIVVILSQFVINCGGGSSENVESAIQLQPRISQPAVEEPQAEQIQTRGMICGDMEFCKHECSLKNPIGYDYQIAKEILTVKRSMSANGTNGADLKKLSLLETYSFDFQTCVQAPAHEIIGVESLPLQSDKVPLCKDSMDCDNTCFNYYKPVADKDYLDDAARLCPTNPIINCRAYYEFLELYTKYRTCLNAPQDEVMVSN